MSSPSSAEVDAKIATVEARLEGHVAAIHASIDGLVMRMDERDKRLEERDKQTDERFARLEKLFEKTQESISNLKTTTIVTGLSAVIAIVLGVGAINATLLSNMTAAFQAGASMGATQAEIKRQVEETAVLLKQLQAGMPPVLPAKPAGSTPPSRRP
ncbi:hypothetical protein GCM10027321_42630 [Massilia terrae]|uniref:Uncharacterized protein n=1 Tax=Massilia terrae TaxID=1811224 RepID=A0ABT2CYK5_9BURK|nr:hypothetical protein [Massilia terrae]MCS0659064.1 hypothetical protein [Massilia terrae]